MESLLVLVSVATLSVLASSRRLLRAGRDLGLSQLFASGLPFAILGALLGPAYGKLISEPTLLELEPLLALGLGVCGLILGLNLDLRVLRRLPAAVYGASFRHSFAAFVAITVPLSAVVYANTHLGVPDSLAAAAVLGAAGSVSSAHLALLWTRAGKLDRLYGLSVSIIAMLDDVVGLSVLALAIVIGGASTIPIGLLLVAAAAGTGVLCGALTAFLIHGLDEGPELTATLIGMAAVTAGAAAYVRLSTLIVGVFAGATLMLIGGRSVTKASAAILRIERPVYLSLLFLIGAHLKLESLVWLIVLVAFVALRFVGKIFGGRAATKSAGVALPALPELGYALIAQGGVAVCIAIEYLLLVPSKGSQLVLDVTVLGAVVNELLAARTFGRALIPKPARLKAHA